MAFGFFKRGGNSPTTELPAGGAKIVRRSSGLAELNKLISGREEMTVLDLGPTSPPNLRYLTERGHSFYNEDVLLSSFEAEVESNTIEVHVSRLRKKLGHDVIETVRGLGYRLGRR